MEAGHLFFSVGQSYHAWIEVHRRWPSSKVPNWKESIHQKLSALKLLYFQASTCNILTKINNHRLGVVQATANIENYFFPLWFGPNMVAHANRLDLFQVLIWVTYTTSGRSWAFLQILGVNQIFLAVVCLPSWSRYSPGPMHQTSSPRSFKDWSAPLKSKYKTSVTHKVIYLSVSQNCSWLELCHLWLLI